MPRSDSSALYGVNSTKTKINQQNISSERIFFFILAVLSYLLSLNMGLELAYNDHFLYKSSTKVFLMQCCIR